MLNRYSFVEENPLKNRDPSGHAEVSTLPGTGSTGTTDPNGQPLTDGDQNSQDPPYGQPVCAIFSCTPIGNYAVLVTDCEGPACITWVVPIPGVVGPPSNGEDPDRPDDIMSSGEKASSAQTFDEEGEGERYRTKHGQEQADEGRRTGPAFSDAQRATRSQVAYDTQSGNFVVRGRRGRYQVFDQNGGHVTEVDYPANAWNERHRSGRWVELSDDQWARFQQLYQH